MNFLQVIDEGSEWWQNALKAPKEVDRYLLAFGSVEYNSRLNTNRALAKKVISIQKKVDSCQAALNSMRKAQEAGDEEPIDAVDSNVERSSGEISESDTNVPELALVDNLNNATKELEEALKNCLDHASQTKLGHQNKVRHALNKLRPLVTNYLKKSSKQPRGKMQYVYRAGIKAVGGKFL
eukprot:CAMPEP_0201732040 /NCGR_PEP_ID=MMETSP0593-20130828/27745_1 /ASSEMBLY_ACC=CAM_ASM_000672 /TAXON_ID=267983 /ORGANISM="Skeletonema japonicum, Strain CCMP2506" /LENGTH=180 /DNA_ID=CAMNT_0048224943 /DNA_START=39 /DNA_END=578 /DNA_ORIENTATION=-